MDVGHHYGAPGAISAGGIAEMEFNLELADEVKRSLEHSGMIVRMIANQVSLRERTREAAMRQIDPKDHSYDGSRERRLPEGRK